MKCLVIALFFTFSLHARTMDLLKCLGEEEKKLHLKKDVGPTYELNQKLIAEIIQVPNVDIERESLQKICDSKVSPSWKLLELSLREGRKIFLIQESETGMKKNINESMISDYIDSSKEIFLALISQIQTISPSPDCLTKEFPILIGFFQDLKYLQEEVDMNKIFKGREKKIFESLKDYPKALKKCQDRLKKKERSESTSALKKS